jgi:hypothetical protein
MPTLGEKLKARRRKQRRVGRKMRRYKARGQTLHWSRARKRWWAQEKAIRKLTKIAKRQPALSRVQVTPESGHPHWGGSGDVVAQFIEPFMQKRGLPIGSGKRTPSYNRAIGGSPTSDHLTTKSTTMARDFPTFSGADDAVALARAMGYNGWQANSYSSFQVVCDQYRFSVQILWGSSIGHGDHVHVGVNR